jgi:hypothetical membrane protein
MFVEMVEHFGVFHGAKAVIVAASTAILLEVTPIIVMLARYTPTEVDPIRSVFIPNALWGPIIVVELTFVLILIVVIATKSPAEDELIYEEALDLLTELVQRTRNQKSGVIESEEDTRKTASSGS